MLKPFLLLFALLVLWPAESMAQSGAFSSAPAAPPKHVQVSLVPEKQGVSPGGTITVGLRQIIDREWHTYWRNPGDSGQATAIVWHLPPGWAAGPIQWPYPSRIPTGPLMNFAYSNEVVLLSDLTAPAGAKLGENVRIDADVTWLVCKDVCVPEDDHVSLTLTVVASLLSPQPSVDLIAQARAALPRPSPWNVVYAAADKNFALLVESPDLTKAAPRDVAFFPYTDGIVEAAAAQTLSKGDKGLVIVTQSGHRLTDIEESKSVSRIDGVLVLTGADGNVDAFEIAAQKGEVPMVVALANVGNVGLLRALLFAFLGGLILNLMPCVLPVLSMKALALARKAGAERAAHIDSLAYTAGVMLCFVLLAALLLILRAGGEAIGWGFQLQQPIVVASLALLMFAVGLNLSGLFEIDMGRLAGVGQSATTKGGAAGSFFTGLLTVAVATPCTAPFMGAAMGFALTQSAIVALSIFVALGLGFALPFLVLGYSPALLRLLPKPGAWMVTFKQVVAFPMYAAAVWLAWVLSQQVDADGVTSELAAALALAFALWAYGVSQRARGAGRVVALLVVTLGLAAMLLLLPTKPSLRADVGPNMVSAGALGYAKYSATKLAELRAARTPVFVNATAAWCITCLANERVALSGDGLAADFSMHHIAVLKADWTNRDPEITALLAGQGRSGVPLYLYYAPGAASPVVLPQLLTKAIVRAALGLPKG